MGRPPKVMPMARIKELIGKEILIKTRTGAIKGTLISADAASIFVMTNNVKTNLRVDELKSIEESNEEQEEE